MKLIWTDPSIEDLRAVRDYIGRASADLFHKVRGFSSCIVINLWTLVMFRTAE